MGGFTKFLLFLLIAILVLGTSLWYVGGHKREYETKSTIAAPANFVFPFLLQPDLRNEWIEGLESMTHVTEDPIDQNSQFQSTYNFGQGSEVAHDTILQLEKNEMLSLQTKFPSKEAASIFRLESIGDKTSLTYTVKESSTGLGRLWSALRRQTTQERINREIMALRRLVEERYAAQPLKLPESPRSNGSDR